MPIAENTPSRLVLKSGSTTLTLDKKSGQATLQRKLLFWALSPAQTPLSEVTGTSVDVAVDRASGVEIFHTVLIMRSGVGWAFPASDKQNAQANSAAIREFLTLPA